MPRPARGVNRLADPRSNRGLERLVIVRLGRRPALVVEDERRALRNRQLPVQPLDLLEDRRGLVPRVRERDGPFDVGEIAVHDADTSNLELRFRVGPDLLVLNAVGIEVAGRALNRPGLEQGVGRLAAVNERRMRDRPDRREPGAISLEITQVDGLVIAEDAPWASAQSAWSQAMPSPPSVTSSMKLGGAGQVDVYALGLHPFAHERRTDSTSRSPTRTTKTTLPRPPLVCSLLSTPTTDRNARRRAG